MNNPKPLIPKISLFSQRVEPPSVKLVLGNNLNTKSHNQLSKTQAVI
jgi:hypothetical protein